MHSLVSYFVTIATGIWAIKMIQTSHENGEEEEFSLHKVFGLVTTFCAIGATLGGMVTAGLGRFYKTKPWQHHKEIHNKLGKLHKLSSYAIIVIGFVACMTGLFVYSDKFLDHNNKYAIANLVCVPAIAFSVEALFRLWRRRVTREMPV